MLDDLDRLMEKSQIDALMAIGNAFETPDIYWLTGFRSGDVITYVKNVGEEAVVASFFNTLERVQKESNIKQTYDLSDTMIGMLKEGRNPRKHLDVFDKEVTQEVVNGKIIGVPNHYPAHRLVILQKLGYEVKVVSDLLQEARATKSAAEVKAIVRAGKATTGAISSVLEMVKDSDIGTNKVLIHKGKPLTVGTMKLALEHHLLDNNAESAEDSILAVGKKAFDWHYLGRPTDKMKADTPVILDVFPRLKHDRYVADVTRTFVRGTPTPKVKHMFESIQAAANASVDALTDGSKIDHVNLACFETLKKHGYDSRRLNPEAKDGMTHGLGHGIGLAVHELPSMYNREELFMSGHVMAIEPGVYLKAHGGVRIENDYLVTKGKAKLLTKGLDEILYL